MTKRQIFEVAEMKEQIFDKKLKPAFHVLILTEGKRGEKGKNKINIKIVATLERRKEKLF